MSKTTSILVASAALAAFAVAGAGTPKTATAQEVKGPEITLKFSTWGKRRAFTEGIETQSKIAKEKTGGNLNIKIFYGEQLSESRENLDNIKAGAIEMAQFCASYHPGKNPALMVLDLPFLPIKDPRVEIAVHEAVYNHPIAIKEMKAWNAKIIMSSILPQYEFLGVGDPPLKLENWKGMTVRALGGLGEAMEKLGAVKVTPPATEVFKGLETGTIRAVSLPFTYSHVAYGLDQIADWFTSNMSPGSVNCPTVIALDVWNDLPRDYQSLILSTKEPAYEKLIESYAASDKKNLPMFRKKMKEIKYSDETLAHFREIAAKPVWDEWVARNKDKFDAQALLDLVLKTADEASKK